MSAPSRDELLAAVASWPTTAVYAAAGFIMPDGRMLDFGNGRDYRAMDHREIVHVHENLVGETAGMRQFMAGTGAIRLGVTEGAYHAYLHLAVAPTAAQVGRVTQMIRELPLECVEVFDLEADRRDQWNWPSAAEVVGMMRRVTRGAPGGRGARRGRGACGPGWFHATTFERLPGICRAGLDPRRGGTRFEHGGYGAHGAGRVFLAQGEEAAREWLGKIEDMAEYACGDDEEPDGRVPVLLRLRRLPAGVRARRDPVGDDDIRGSFFVTRRVPPELLLVWDPRRAGWVDLCSADLDVWDGVSRIEHYDADGDLVEPDGPWTSRGFYVYGAYDDGGFKPPRAGSAGRASFLSEPPRGRGPTTPEGYDQLAADYHAWDRAYRAALRGEIEDSTVALRKYDKARRRWALSRGVIVLGVGSNRIAFGVPGRGRGGALKVPLGNYPGGGDEENRLEAMVSRCAPRRVRRHLVPVVAADLAGRWLLMPRVKVTGRGVLRPGALRELGRFSITDDVFGATDDYRAHNVADDGRVFDYSFLAYGSPWLCRFRGGR